MKRILLLLLITFTALAVSAAELPDLGSPTGYLVSEKEQFKLKQQTRARLSEETVFLRDILAQYYIQRLGERLRQASHTKEKEHFDFFVINSPVINAFAAPGGYVGVNAGLILASEDEDELAAVLAHEVSHVTQGHILRAYAHAKRMKLPMLLGGIAMVAIGMANPELGSGVMLGGMAGLAQNQATFSREHEQEADRFGLAVMQRAGFDPRAMIRVFERFSKQEQYNGINMPEFLRTHPMNAARISDVEHRLNQTTPLAKSKNHSLTFSLIKARVHVFSDQNPGDSQRYFRKILAKTPQSLYARYGLALALLHMAHGDQALALLHTLQKEQPDNIIIAITLSEAQQTLKQYKEANLALQKLALNYPDDIPITALYAENLLHAKEIGKAQTTLSHALIKHPDNILLLELMVRTQFARGERARAYWYLAKIHTLLEQPDAAKAKLKRALTEKPLDYYLKEKIKAKLAEPASSRAQRGISGES